MPLDDSDSAALLRQLPGAEQILRLPMFSRDSTRTVDAGRLASEIEAAGVTTDAVFTTFEEHFGGLRVGETTIGIHAALRTHKPDADGGVPCVGGNLDLYFVLRPDGTVWFRERLSMPAQTRIAARPQSFVYRYLWYATPRFLDGARLQIRGHQGASIADILGALPVPAASDDVERLWESDTVSIHETPDMQYIVDPVDPDRPPNDITNLICDDPETLDKALQAARARLPDLSWRPDDFADWS